MSLTNDQKTSLAKLGIALIEQGGFLIHAADADSTDACTLVCVIAREYISQAERIVASGRGRTVFMVEGPGSEM